MPKLFARFVALMALVAVSGCSGGGTGPLPQTGFSQPGGAAGGGAIGSGVSGGANSPPASSTATVTCPDKHCVGPEGYFVSVNFPSTLTLAPGTTVTLTLETSVVTGGALQVSSSTEAARR